MKMAQFSLPLFTNYFHKLQFSKLTFHWWPKDSIWPKLLQFKEVSK